jgi:sugar lactone lactonase YvrE
MEEEAATAQHERTRMTDSRPQLSIVGTHEPEPAAGWTFERLVGPSNLFGANGIQFGPDGRLYVAQALGARISAIDLPTGQIEHVLARGPIVAPDDLDFAADRTAYVTDVATATTWAWKPGQVPIAHAVDQPSNNGVTISAGGRLFVDEFRPGGRLLEVSAGGEPARVILEGLNGPNALDVGGDGRVFFPQVFAGEVWSLDPDTGDTRRVAAGLGSPTAVKVAPDGHLIVSLSAEGVIAQIDPRTGAISTLAEVDPGIDNLALDPSGRVFVSHYVDGQVAEVPVGAAAASQSPRVLNAPGFVGPFDVAERPGGTLIVADGLSLAYVEGSTVSRFARLLTADSPGLISAVHTAPDGRTYIAGGNSVSQYTPAGPRLIHDDFQSATGLALEQADTLLVADHEAGTVLRLHPDGEEVTTLTKDVEHPTRLAIAPSESGDASVYISDDVAGQIHVHHDGATTLFADGLRKPQGLAVLGDRLFAVDAGTGELLAFTRASGAREVIVSGLPVGVPEGVERLIATAGLTATAAGDLIIAADGDGSLIRLTPRT